MADFRALGSHTHTHSRFSVARNGLAATGGRPSERVGRRPQLATLAASRHAERKTRTSLSVGRQQVWRPAGRATREEALQSRLATAALESPIWSATLVQFCAASHAPLRFHSAAQGASARTNLAGSAASLTPTSKLRESSLAGVNDTEFLALVV